MRAPGYPDCLTVVNGPEDGTEFPIVRAPFYVGKDPASAVNIRLDSDVRPFHALVTVVSEGYRVRRGDSAPVYVNGKRAGMYRSRILRSGGLMQVGHTLLVLECAPDGLASRSHGMVHESDFAWFVHLAWCKAYRLVSALVRLMCAFFGRLVTSPMVVVAALVLLYLFYPPLHNRVNAMAAQAYQKVITTVVEKVLERDRSDTRQGELTR